MIYHRRLGIGLQLEMNTENLTLDGQVRLIFFKGVVENPDLAPRKDYEDYSKAINAAHPIAR